MQCTQRNARFAGHNATAGRKQATVCIVTACHNTDAHTHDSNDCYSLRILLLRVCSETGEFWTTLKIALRNAHFRYRGSIEYRDTRDGIVIVAPISGIAQHYLETVQVISIHSQEVVYGFRFLGYQTSPWKTWTGVMAVILRYSPNSATWEQLRQSSWSYTHILSAIQWYFQSIA